MFWTLKNSKRNLEQIRQRCYEETIRRKEKDGDWYIYLKRFAHEHSENAYKNTKKNCKSFKLDKSNGVSVVDLYMSYIQIIDILNRLLIGS